MYTYRQKIYLIRKKRRERKKKNNALIHFQIEKYMYNLGGSLSLRCMIREKEKDCERYRDKKTYLHERR